MEFEFDTEVIEWRGPPPYLFAVVPVGPSETIHDLAGALTYGWGAIPVSASIGGEQFTTSLFPRDGHYLLPLKEAVRRPAGVAAGSRVSVRLVLAVR